MLLLAQADARAIPLADRSVQCVVTSPPYWGLRDYGTARWAGGDPACDHKAPQAWASDSGDLGVRGGVLNANEVKAMRRHGPDCLKCGATRMDPQIGLEGTPDRYVAEMVAVFREIWRVLKNDGTVWLNIGDSYSSGGRTTQVPDSLRAGQPDSDGTATRPPVVQSIRPKSMVGIPWRVALALMDDGWILRSDIIWSKPNPMPESVTDRPTKAHEYVFLLAKAERYYFDADAVREVGAGRMDFGLMTSPARLNQGGPWTKTHKDEPDGRNIRSVWSIATQPYPGAHFATMPEKLVERCILAGSKAGDIVLDPFMGSGTVARVALRLGRRAVGFDLNAEYLRMARRRTRVQLPLELLVDEEEASEATA